jgi:hypothetical protein
MPCRSRKCRKPCGSCWPSLIARSAAGHEPLGDRARFRTWRAHRRPYEVGALASDGISRYSSPYSVRQLLCQTAFHNRLDDLRATTMETTSQRASQDVRGLAADRDRGTVAVARSRRRHHDRFGGSATLRRCLLLRLPPDWKFRSAALSGVRGVGGIPPAGGDSCAATVAPGGDEGLRIGISGQSLGSCWTCRR